MLKATRLRAEHLADAAGLFAGRFAEARKRESLLPGQYENPAKVLPLLEEMLAENPMVAAFRKGRIVGILGGIVLPDFRGRKAIYSQEWANGLAPGEERGAFWKMYESICGDWVSDGCRFHVFTVVSADAETVFALRWAGFFGMAVDAVRDLDPVEGGKSGVEVRLAGPGDVAEVLRLKNLHVRHMHAPPVLFPFAKAEERERNAALLADPAQPIWLAFVDGRSVGYIGGGPLCQEAGFLLRDAKTASVTGAFVEMEHRGKGIAPALLQTVVNWAREQGMARLAVDFEPENTVASRFWCQHFRVVGLSFGRIVQTNASRKAGD